MSAIRHLHPCLTIDGQPTAMAESIFDAVIGERRELLADIEHNENNLEWMHRRRGCGRSFITSRISISTADNHQNKDTDQSKHHDEANSESIEIMPNEANAE